MKERKKNVSELTKWKEQLETVLSDFLAQVQLSSEHTLVIGCSTSEVIGEKIGTAGAMEVAEMIFDTLADFRRYSYRIFKRSQRKCSKLGRCCHVYTGRSITTISIIESEI